MSKVEKDPAKGLNAALAATLNGERTAAGMTFDQLAAATGISKRTLLRKISTTERALDIEEAAIIAAQFDLTLGEALSMASQRVARMEGKGRKSAPGA